MVLSLKTNNVVTQHAKSKACPAAAALWWEINMPATQHHYRAKHCWPHHSENPMKGQNVFCSGPARETLSAEVESTCQSTEGAEADRNLSKRQHRKKLINTKRAHILIETIM